MFREMRRKKQEVGREECVRVLREGKRAAFSVNGEDGYPYTLPLNYWYNEENNTIYFHCAKAGHKLDAITNDNKVCFTVWDEGYQKEDWSYYVTSVIVFGKARVVEDETEKYESAKAFGAKYFPTKEELDHELAHSFDRCNMVAISVDHMTGKLVHEK